MSLIALINYSNPQHSKALNNSSLNPKVQNINQYHLNKKIGFLNSQLKLKWNRY